MLKRKRPNQKKVKGPPKSQATQFVERRPSPPVPEDIQVMVLDALTVFQDRPESRSRSYWYFDNKSGYKVWSLLGMLCCLQGFDFADCPSDQHNWYCRTFLNDLGFNNYMILAIQEINNHSIKLDVLEERLISYMTTGERMPFLDLLHEYDMTLEKQT